jgi:hypothetical protein
VPSEQPDREYCDDQALRLQAMPRFSRDPRVATEYADALMGSCRSNDVARAVVDEILEYSVDVPTIADIRRMANSKNPPAEPQHCKTCSGSGYTSGTYLVTKQNGKTSSSLMTRDQAEKFFHDHGKDLQVDKQMIYDAAAPCPDCRLGRALSARALELSQK